MIVEDILSRRRTTVVRKWFHQVLETYPPDTSRFMEQEEDKFANPVGATIFKGIEILYDELLHGMNPGTISDALDSIIRIRSVQGFSPSQAIAFIFHLKGVIRGTLESVIHDDRVFEELSSFDSKIDRLALMAFDSYMKCREKIFEIRVHEVNAQKRMAITLLERTNRIIEKMRIEEVSTMTHSNSGT